MEKGRLVKPACSADNVPWAADGPLEAELAKKGAKKEERAFGD